MNTFLVSLLLVSGAFVFLVGFAVGWQVVSHAVARRERWLAKERAILNVVWGRLRRRSGVDRAVWLVDFWDRERSRYH